MKIIEKIGRKSWTQEQIDKYVGSFRQVYFSYALDAEVRSQAASGGSTTALLAYLLETGEVDGALVVKTETIDGKVTCRFVIARTKGELMSARGSKYMAVYFSRDAVPLIREFEGTLAVTALPCDATTLQRLSQKDPQVAGKVKYVFGIVCGHNSEPELTEHIVRDLGKGHGKLVDYKYRTGHWRGHLTAVYEDGAEVQRPFRYFSDYRNVYFFAQKKCHRCYDHFAYNCDVSVGDIWSLYLKKEPIKHTALISRSEAGDDLVRRAARDGILHLEEQDVREVLDGQSRTCPFHYNVTSRAKIGTLIGEKINDRVHERVKWNDYVVAAIAMANSALTDRPWGRAVAKRIPRPVLRAYVFFFKGLELF